MRTVAHLRPGQVAHRLRYRLRRARWERRADAVDGRYRQRASALPPVRFDHPGLARVAGYRIATRPEDEALRVADDALAGRFTFHGHSETFGPEVDWFRPDLDAGTRLWKTLLHEFSFATDLARAARTTGESGYRERLFGLARHWRAAAPIGCRDFALDAWNARAAATRLMHWAVAGQVLGLSAGDPDADWLGGEIALHGLFLRDNLELDLRGNHLFRDAVGLVFADELAGGIPDALAQLERQIAEQVLPDGGHVERAPFYHALCTQDLLEVRLLLGASAPGWLDDALSRMAGFLAEIALGDGEIPLLGDGWLGEVSTPALLAAAREVRAPVRPQAPELATGLVPLHAGPWRVVVRAGRHAPDEQMGHAHGDLLSFDASWDRARIVTDTGTLLYDPGPDRQRIRSTAAHNTIAVDGAEQIEAWGSFRVGRRGRARVLARGSAQSWQWLSASHDAYRWLAGGPIHHRLIAVGDEGILVLDAIRGPRRHRFESFLHEHPSCAATGVRIAALGPAAVGEEAPLHERFGETRSLRLHRASGEGAGWIGGWWIGIGADRERVGHLRSAGDAVELQLTDPQLRLTWRPHSTDARDAVSLCFASVGSAT